MNPANYQPPPNHPFHWAPMLPPDPPRCGVFWNTNNITDQLKQLQDTLHLAKSMEKELDALRMIKDGKVSMESVEEGSGAECLKRYLEGVKIDLEEQEKLSVEAANSLMSTLRAQLAPFRFVVDENSPWEEKSAAARLTCRMKKSKRNKLWKKKKRRCVAEMRAKEPERFELADREADEWREKEMAKDMANRKVDEMKAIEKVKAKRERRRLEPELELALIVEEMQELRSLRIEKLKKQGHFLPEEDDKFFESVRAAVEQEENQAQSVTNTEAEGNVIASEEDTSLTTDNKIIKKDTDKESNTVAAASCEKTIEASPDNNSVDNVSNLPVECYHYYYGSNLDMGRLIEIRREWDAYLSPGGSRIPGHWVHPSPPDNEIWASCQGKSFVQSKCFLTLECISRWMMINDQTYQRVQKVQGIATAQREESYCPSRGYLEPKWFLELKGFSSQLFLWDFLPKEDDKFVESVRAAVEQEENQAQSVTNTEAGENVTASKEDTSLTTDNKIINKDTDKESNTVAPASCEKTIEAPPDNGCDNVSNLPVECYHYYYESNLDMGRLIEIRREWDVYLSPGGSRIPGQWVHPSPPANEVWASCLVKTPKSDLS